MVLPLKTPAIEIAFRVRRRKRRPDHLEATLEIFEILLVP